MVDVALMNPGKTAGSPPIELPGVTSLRGIAAIIVVLFHANFLEAELAGGRTTWVWVRGYLAVDLFFFLSGFVLTHVYGRHFVTERSWRGVRKFFWARFCRIYPTSLFVIVMFVLAGAATIPSFKVQLVAALLLMQVPWLDHVAINNPSWSISAELYAYLLFPFVVPQICRLRRQIAALVCVALLIGIVVDHTMVTQQDTGWGALLRVLPEFTAGALAYQFYDEQPFRTIWEKDATLIGVVVTIIAANLAGASDGLIVPLLLALLLASVCNSGRMAGFLNAKPLRWLGEASYSIYISQTVPGMLVIALYGSLATYGFTGTRCVAVIALLVVGNGVLVHRCIDLPIRGALRRLPDWATAFAATHRAAAPIPVPVPMPVVPAVERDI